MSQEKVLANAPSIVRYIKHRVNISKEQREKFLSAIGEREAVSIRFRYEDLSDGDDLIAFTMQQFKRIASAFDKGRGVIINMSEDQVQIHGAFIDIVYKGDDYFFFDIPVNLTLKPTYIN